METESNENAETEKPESEEIPEDKEEETEDQNLTGDPVLNPEECNNLIEEKIDDLKKKGRKKVAEEKKQTKLKTNKKGEYKKKGKVVYLKKDGIWQKFTKGIYRAVDFVLNLPYWDTFLNIFGSDVIFYFYLRKIIIPSFLRK